MLSGVFARIEQRKHEHISYFYCPVTKLKAIVAIHSTVLGPALGGCRMRVYGSEEEALEDVMRLSEGMTLKNSVAGMNLGGGKACIIADPEMQEGRQELFTQFGRYIQTLGGAYYTAKDMGTRVADMQSIKQETDYCVGGEIESGGSGDPSPWTALGVYNSIKAVAEKKLKKSMSELKVGIEGVGSVGYRVAELLHKEGVKLNVADINSSFTQRASDQLGAKILTTKELCAAKQDIYSPCAIGQTVNEETVAAMQCSAIVGAANNQISESSIYKQIIDKKILYCPDFVVNAGGVISVGAELNQGGWDMQWVEQKVSKIADTLIEVLDLAEKSNEFPEVAALKMARQRIDTSVE